MRLKVTPLWVPETTQNSHHAFMMRALIEPPFSEVLTLTQSLQWRILESHSPKRYGRAPTATRTLRPRVINGVLGTRLMKQSSLREP